MYYIKLYNYPITDLWFYEVFKKLPRKYLSKPNIFIRFNSRLFKRRSDIRIYHFHVLI